MRNIGTRRLILRPWREEDAPNLFKYASNPEVGPRAGWPPHQSAAESLEIIRTVFSGEGMWAVVDYCFNVIGFTTLWGDYFPENPASGEVMANCGFIDTGKEVLCTSLEVGFDKPVRVMRLEYAKKGKFTI